MKKFIWILVSIVVLLPITAVAANPEATVIRVVPVSEPHTGWAIITDSPAFLQINVTTAAHSPINDVRLLFVIDHDTYVNLNSINTTGTDWDTTLYPTDFTGGPLSSDGSTKIPETNDTNWEGPHPYPGCIHQTQYELGAILSQMSQVYATTMVHYVLVYAFDSISTSEKYFTVNVDSTHINVLILAQGRHGGEAEDPLTNNSPFSGSTLLVPQLAPVLLALASFSAFALYAVKRRNISHLK